MTVDLKDPTLLKRWKLMTDEEKLDVVDAIIDRDAAAWKAFNRNGGCDFYYYRNYIQGGLALTERQR